MRFCATSSGSSAPSGSAVASTASPEATDRSSRTPGTTARTSSTNREAGLRPADHRLGPRALRAHDRFFGTAQAGRARGAARDDQLVTRRSAEHAARRTRGRRPGGRLQPDRAAPPLVHRGRIRRRELQRVHVASTTRRATSRRSTCSSSAARTASSTSRRSSTPCDTVFLAQEILVGYSSYPTPEIERNAKAFRQLGLGYANLGALLMARGLPYDSDEGRAYAAAITALMTGRAYRKSAEIAARMGAFAGHAKNRARDAERDLEAPRVGREHRERRHDRVGDLLTAAARRGTTRWTWARSPATETRRRRCSRRPGRSAS